MLMMMKEYSHAPTRTGFKDIYASEAYRMDDDGDHRESPTMSSGRRPHVTGSAASVVGGHDEEDIPGLSAH